MSLCEAFPVRPTPVVDVTSPPRFSRTPNRLLSQHLPSLSSVHFCVVSGLLV